MFDETEVRIVEAKTKKELRLFRDFPDKLYTGYKNYVPDFKDDEFKKYFPKTNGAFEYCDVKCFLAYQFGEVVGRVMAINSRKANEKWGTKRVRISRMDFIDDYDVSGALFKAVEDYARELGLNEVHGPIGFCDMDKEGLQIEGFEYDGMSITYNNYPYYMDHFDFWGYTKSTDWVEYRLYMPEKDSPAVKKLEKLSELVLRRTKLKLVNIKRISEAGKVLRQIFDLLNECYKNLYGMVAMTPKMADEYYNGFKSLLNPKFVKFIVDENENLVAFGLAAPSLNKALRKTKGRLFPFGFIDILKATKGSDVIDLYLVAVHPDYQKAGLPAVLMNEILKSAIETGVKYAETGPELETNEQVQSLWKFFDHDKIKRRRCYIKNLDEWEKKLAEQENEVLNIQM